ncbi:hypothetical protein [Parvicella tangerina]|nr:hypothetical protein [Parvicella tangerina]
MSFSRLLELLAQHNELQVRQLSSSAFCVESNGKELVVSVENIQQKHWRIEEQWLKSPIILFSKILNKLGLSHRIHARKCEVHRIDKPTLETFLTQHHLYGVAGAKHKFGLFHDNELVALVSFATPRMIEGKLSAELVRYCVKSGYSIPGGLDKLLKHYTKIYPCDDIFTYVDLAWSSGIGFKKIGFQEEGTKIINKTKVLRLRLITDRNSSHPHT